MFRAAPGNLGHFSYLMSHTALARKYRPKRFADLVAQEHVAAGLTGAVVKNRVAHGYLLTGPRGVGKTTAARILAMALNCDERAADGANAGEPCGMCESCSRIWAGSTNLDVIEIDAATNRGVDDARQLRERAMYAASGADRFKIYIIDEAHMLTREAWNALLKILEEPPPRVVFVFATTEPQKIANTAAPVMSRLQRFDFRRIGPGAIVERLRYVVEAEELRAEEDALVLIARVARGGMRDGLSLLDQALAFGDEDITAERVRSALGLISDELYAELLDIVAQHRTTDVFPFVSKIVEAGADLAELVGGAGEVLRALMVRILGDEPAGLTDELRRAVDHHAASFAQGDVLRMLKLLAEAEQAVRRSPNVRLHVETLLLEWTLLDRTVELEDVITALRLGVHESERSAPPRSPERASARQRPPAPAKARAPAARVPTAPAPGPADPASTSVETLRASWPAVLEAAGKQRRVVREALTHARPATVEGSVITLDVADTSVHLEGLERNKAVVAGAIATVIGGAFTVAYRPAESGESVPRSEEPQRLDRDKDREERLRHYRKKDPALDAVAEALDLELLE